MNSGGVKGTPHFIDINPGGTGPRHKATFIEWGVRRFFLKPFSLKNGGDPVQKGQVTKLKIHLYPIDPVRQKIRDCRFRQILSIPAESAGLEKTYFREFSKILERDSI